MKQHWTKLDLIKNWTFSSDELEYLSKKTTKLVFGIKMKYFEQQGYFPNAGSDVPLVILEYAASQLATKPDDLVQYPWQERISQLHNQELREYHGFRKINDADHELIYEFVNKKLLVEALPVNQIIAHVYEFLKKNKIEPSKTTHKQVSIIYVQCEQQFFDGCLKSISITEQENMLKILDAHDDTQSVLNFIRNSAGKLSSDTIVEELNKLSYINLTGILKNKYFETISKKLLRKYYTKVAILSPSLLREVKETNSSKFYALLACFCRYKGARVVDNLIEIFIRRMRKMQSIAKSRAKEELWEHYSNPDNNSLLNKIIDISLAHPEGVIRDKIYTGVGGKETLEQNKESRKLSSRQITRRLEYQQLNSLYSYHRKYLMLILKALDFDLTNKIGAVAKSIIEKAQALEEYYAKDSKIVVSELISSGDLSIIRNSEGRYKRTYYELAIFNLLASNLKCKNIWVRGAGRHSNPSKDLPQDFDSNKSFYFNNLSLPENSEEFIEEVREEQTASIRIFNANILNNEDVSIGLKRGKPHIYLTPYKPQDEPQNITELKQQVACMWPNISLLDILKEADLRIGLTTELIEMVDKTSIPRDLLRQRLLLCLFSIATNTEFKKICAGAEGTNEDDLSYVKKRYLTVEAFRYIIIKLVNSTLAIRDKAIWGEILLTSFGSDSTQFPSVESNLMTEFHVRYRGNGIMAYWHVDRKALCISSQIRRCSVSEIAAMLIGIIHHASNAKVEHHSTDTHGQSLVAFAFAKLLGINLRPRIKGIGKLKLNKVDTNMAQGDYINLKEVMDRPIKWQLIKDNYEEMVKNATALVVGTADVEVILKRFISENAQDPLYQALLELGRAERTSYLCKYYSIKELRIEVEEVLNVVENWNSGNNFIFFGKRGVISSNNETDQEISILALHLQQSSLTYVNTLMQQQILRTSAWKDRLTLEDKRALTPLFYNHINQYGTYKLDMRERLIIEES